MLYEDVYHEKDFGTFWFDFGKAFLLRKYYYAYLLRNHQVVYEEGLVHCSNTYDLGIKLNELLFHDDLVQLFHVKINKIKGFSEPILLILRD